MKNQILAQEEIPPNLFEAERVLQNICSHFTINNNKMRIIIFVLFLCGGNIAAQPITFFKEYGGSKSDYAHSVTLTSDGGYAIVGRTSSFEIGPANVYLIKTDSFGEIIWDNIYGSVHSDQGFDIQETFDEGYVVAGALGEPDSMS